MESFVQDLKHSIRMFLQAPAFTVTAVLALALGVGANTAIFSFINRVLLMPMPYPDPDRFVFFMNTSPQGFPVPEHRLPSSTFGARKRNRSIMPPHGGSALPITIQVKVRSRFSRLKPASTFSAFVERPLSTAARFHRRRIYPAVRTWQS
jgi:hypothetical protein